MSYEVSRSQDGMADLRALFPDGKADDLNMVLFSTSGIHGTYCTIESCEAGDVSEVTFLLVQPRAVMMKYGNAKPQNPEDFAFLKSLRSTSTVEFVKWGMR